MSGHPEKAPTELRAYCVKNGLDMDAELRRFLPHAREMRRLMDNHEYAELMRRDAEYSSDKALVGLLRGYLISGGPIPEIAG